MKDKMCCFDGSVRTYDTAKREKIKEIIIDLIEKESVRKFCVIRKSRIDGVVMPILEGLRTTYTDIKLGLICPNMSEEGIAFIKRRYTEYDFFLTDTISRKTPKGWEIKNWGQYMADCSSHMICCTDSKTGKSAETLAYAKEKGDIRIFNILGK